MLRVDGGGQAQGPRERAVRQFANEIAALSLFVGTVVLRCAAIVFALNTDDIFQHLNVQFIGTESRHKRRKNVGLTLGVLTDVDSESLITVFGPAACHTAIGISL